MLYEARCKPDLVGEPTRRRWFTDDFFDLFVWYTDDDSVLGFQLCYDKRRDEHALTWRRDTGFTHKCVDDGGRSQRQATPWLLPDGTCDCNAILTRFLQESPRVDQEIVHLVARKLEEYGNL